MLLCHFPLCPLSRKVRLLLHEKNLDFEQKILFPQDIKHQWGKDSLPVLYENEWFVSGAGTISEYIEEKFKETSFFGSSLKIRASVREISSWLDNELYRDAVYPIINEKVLKPIREKLTPDSGTIRNAKKNILEYIEILEKMILRNIKLANETFTVADITLASHISSLDYTNDFPWEKAPIIKHWYSLIKSRPSFRNILSDKISPIQPPAHYGDPDF